MIKDNLKFNSLLKYSVIFNEFEVKTNSEEFPI